MRPESDYSALVSRVDHRPVADFWPFNVPDPLPIVPVPLRPEDGEAHLDLRAVLDRVYDKAGYGFFIYDHDPDPPLSEPTAAWARAILSSSAKASS
jgi:hypothetical protein